MTDDRTNQNVDAVSIDAMGNILVSYALDQTSTGGLSIGEDDILNTGDGTIFFDGNTIFSATNEDIDAFHYVSATEIYLSTTASAGGSGATWASEDIASWDGTNFTRYVDASNLFGNTTATASDFNLDALTFIVPEPSRAFLLLCGGFALVLRRRRSA